jgi:fatty-acyl-CoA synthase
VDATPGQLCSGRFPDLKWLIHLGAQPASGYLTFKELCALGTPVNRDQLVKRETSFQSDDPINIQFTSGTTGRPKGATLSHFNILNNAYFVAERMKLTPEDRVCIPVPLYHCFGMVMGVLGAISHGAGMVFPGDSFDAEGVLAAVSEEHCTALYGVPTMFIAELEHPRFTEFDISSLRTGIMAGAPCPAPLMQRVMDRMHMHQITICYGMTETSPVSLQTYVDDVLERRVTTVGTVHPHLEVKIVDSDGKIVSRGRAGELLTRGYSVMRGYWGDPERTAQVIDEANWMHTGDLAVMDDAGYCSVVGRVKDMIIRGGENIYPREIEEFLYGHPKLRDVAVVGVPDAKYGEEVCAVVILREGQRADPEEIRSYCRGQIAHYKVPRYVRFVESFPMTVTGKIRKNEIREGLLREFAAATEKEK